GSPLVGPAADGTDARAARGPRPGRRRRPAGQAARVGSRRALVPRDRDAAACESEAAVRGEALPCARRAAPAGTARRPPRGGGRADPRAADVPLAVRPAHPRPGSHRGALGLLLPARDVRAGGEARVRLLRPADPPG